MTDRTEQKACDIMETYLVGNPDILKAIEFLCLAEGGEVTHNEVLSVMTKGTKEYERFAQMQKHIEID
jgi:ribonuclease PH